MAIERRKSNSQIDRDLWIVVCDKCGTPCTKRAWEAGNAAEEARKEGFKPEFKSAEDPALWVCPDCP